MLGSGMVGGVVGSRIINHGSSVSLGKAENLSLVMGLMQS